MPSAVARATGAALLCLLVMSAPAAAQTSGGINTGLPGSTCEQTAKTFTYTPPTDPGVTPGGLGEAAPAYHEVGLPSGDHAGRAPKGVMLILHGGAWYVAGEELVAVTRPIADAWRARGWLTVNSTYRACAPSVGDVVRTFDLARAAYPELPICASGESAGGHLALMLAAQRSDLECVIATGAPTDLPALLVQGAATGSVLYHRAVAAFGLDALGATSPIQLAGQVKARVLLGHASRDPVAPVQQAAAMDADLPGYSDLVILDPGDRPFTHARVHADSAASFDRRVRNLVAPITGEPPAECDQCGAGGGWSRTADPAAQAGTVLRLTMRNDLGRTADGVKTGTHTATISHSETGGTLALRGSATLPAGTWRIHTCWGATGSFVPWSKCVSRDVTTTVTSTQPAPSKDVSFGRLAQAWNWRSYVKVERLTLGLWKPYALSWRGEHGSRLVVPAKGAWIG